VKSGTISRINIRRRSRSYRESAGRKQLSVTFPTHACPQSCTERVRFRQNSRESTHRVFFGAARATPKTEFYQTTRVSKNPSARQKQPSIAFRTRARPQSCTESVAYNTDSRQSTHRWKRFFFGDASATPTTIHQDGRGWRG